MSKPIEVRKLSAEDYDIWSTLWRDYLKFYKTELDEAQFRRSFSRILDKSSQNMHGRLAWIDGRAVGLVHFIMHDHFWRAEKVIYLQDLYTDEATRGQGVGRALIETVYDYRSEHLLGPVYWLTQEFNQEARKLYDNVGALTPFIKYQQP